MRMIEIRSNDIEKIEKIYAIFLHLGQLGWVGASDLGHSQLEKFLL